MLKLDIAVGTLVFAASLLALRFVKTGAKHKLFKFPMALCVAACVLTCFQIKHFVDHKPSEKWQQNFQQGNNSRRALDSMFNLAAETPTELAEVAEFPVSQLTEEVQSAQLLKFERPEPRNPDGRPFHGPPRGKFVFFFGIRILLIAGFIVSTKLYKKSVKQLKKAIAKQPKPAV